MKKETAESLKIFQRNAATGSGGDKFRGEFMNERFSTILISQPLGCRRAKSPGVIKCYDERNSRAEGCELCLTHSDADM